MRLQHSRIKRSSAEFDLSQGPLVFGSALRNRMSGTQNEVPLWLPNTSRDFIRANQAATLEDFEGMDPGLLAAMLDRDTVEMISKDSPLVERPITVAERLGGGLASGAFLGSALQLAAKQDSSPLTKALLGLTGLGVGLGLSAIGPRHPLGKSIVKEWESDPEKPDVVQVVRPDRGLLGGVLGDAIVGGVSGGLIAHNAGVKRLVPFGASIGLGATGLAALNQALAARGDRIYSGRSKQSSAANLEEYLKSQEDYLNLRDNEQKNTAALSLLGAVPGAALSGLGTHTLLNNLVFSPNPSISKGALGLLGLIGGGVLAPLPSKLMQQADARRRRETGIDPGFTAPSMTAPAALTGVGAGVGLLALLKNPTLAATAAGLTGLTGALTVSKALERDRERANFVAANDKSAYAAGRGLAEGNRFVRNLSPGMMYVSPVAPGERVLGSG